MNRNFIILTTLCLTLSACGPRHKEEVVPSAPLHADAVMPAEIVLKGDLKAAKKVLSGLGLQVLEVESMVDSQASDLEDQDVYRVTLARHNLNTKILGTAIDTLRANGQIEYAEPNFILHSKQENNKIPVPKDTYFIDQWGLSNLGQDSPGGTQGEPGSDIHALEAWKLNKGSREIVVGVIDTGVDYNHPDLKGNIWINEKEKNGTPGVDDDGNGFVDDVYGWNFITTSSDKLSNKKKGSPDPMDDNAHGTHCAGIIGGRPDNLQGISGVNWQVKIMALKFLSASGSGNDWDASKAIRYGVDNGAHVLSNSWGGGERSKLVESAIKYANKKGVLFVAAAGNESSNNDAVENFPSNYEVENVLAVAATDNRDQLAEFSNYGSNKVHIAAPGVDIMSTVPVGSSRGRGVPYAAFSGTSMATPYVAGAAALLLSHDKALKGNPAAIKKRLMDSVDVVPQLAASVKSQGRLNIFRALKENKNELNDDGKVESEAYNYTSPALNVEKFDHTLVIQKKGAKRIRVHFSSIEADVPGYDLLAVYDREFRLIFKAESSHPDGYDSPWIEGDTARVRFANAMVAQQSVRQKEYDDADKAFSSGATACLPKDGKFLCIFMDMGKPTPNFVSEGYSIDKIEYVMEAPKAVEPKGDLK